MLDESIELKQSAIEQPTLGNVSVIRKVRSKSSVEGSLKFQMQFNDIERILYNAFGAVATTTHAGESIVYDHTFTLANKLPGGMTLLVDRDSADIGSQFQYPGCYIDKLTLTQEVEKFLLAEVALVGRGQENLTYPIPAPSAHAFNGIDYEMASDANNAVTVNGVTIPAKSSEFALDNGLSKDRYKLGNNLRIDVQRGAVRKVTGKFSLEFQSLAQIQLFENFTPFQVVMQWTGANIAGSSVPTPYSLKITLPNCVLSGKTPNVKDWNVMQQDLEFTCFGTSGNDEITAVLTNDVETMV